MALLGFTPERVLAGYIEDCDHILGNKHPDVNRSLLSEDEFEKLLFRIVRLFEPSATTRLVSSSATEAHGLRVCDDFVVMSHQDQLLSQYAKNRLLSDKRRFVLREELKDFPGYSLEESLEYIKSQLTLPPTEPSKKVVRPEPKRKRNNVSSSKSVPEVDGSNQPINIPSVVVALQPSSLDAKSRLQLLNKAIVDIAEHLFTFSPSILTIADLSKVRLVGPDNQPIRGKVLLDELHLTLARARNPALADLSDDELAGQQDKSRINLQQHLAEILDNHHRILSDIAISEAISLLQNSPERLMLYLRICHPDIPLGQATEIVTRGLRGLRASGKMYQRSLGLPIRLPPLTYLDKNSSEEITTASNSVAVKIAAPDGVDLLCIVGDYNGRIRFHPGAPVEINLPVINRGALSSFQIFGVNNTAQTRTALLSIVVRHTGAAGSTEDEYFFAALQLKKEALRNASNNASRYRLLQRSVELSLLGDFTEDERKGFEKLERRIETEESEIAKGLLSEVKKKFSAIAQTGSSLRAGQRLYFYQRWAVQGLLDAKAEGRSGHILSFEGGMGKTVTALAFAANDDLTILCPNSLVTTWRDEERRFFPEPKLQKLEGKFRIRDIQLGETAPLGVVSNLEYTRKMPAARAQALSREDGVVVVDEGDFLGSRGSQQSIGTKQIGGFKLILTATPFRRLSGLSSVLNYLYPDEPTFQSTVAFHRAFPSASLEVQAAASAILNDNMIRVRKADVFREFQAGIPLEHQSDRLPKKVFIPTDQAGTFVITAEQSQSIRLLFEDYQAWCRGHYGLGHRVHSFEDQRSSLYFEGYFPKREALRQITNDPAYIGLDIESPKHLAMDKIVEAELARSPDAKVLIVCRYRAQVAAYVERYERFGTCRFDGALKSNSDGYLTDESGNLIRFLGDKSGSLVLDERGRPIRSWDINGLPLKALDEQAILFQNSPDKRVMAMTFDTGSVGQTFTAAWAVVFDDLASTYRDENQASERAHRIDNSRKKYEVHYYRLKSEYPRSFLDSLPYEIREKYFSQGTFDELQISALRRQEQLFHRVVDGFGSLDELTAAEREVEQTFSFLFKEKAQNRDISSSASSYATIRLRDEIVRLARLSLESEYGVESKLMPQSECLQWLEARLESRSLAANVVQPNEIRITLPRNSYTSNLGPLIEACEGIFEVYSASGAKTTVFVSLGASFETQIQKSEPSLRSTIEHDRVVGEIADYLIANNGFDQLGRAHPSLARVRISFIEEAIGRAIAGGLTKSISAIECSNAVGITDRVDLLNELVRRCVEDRCKSDFNGDFATLFNEANLSTFLLDRGVRDGHKTPGIEQFFAVSKVRLSVLLERYLELNGALDIRLRERVGKISLFEEVISRSVGELIDRQSMGSIVKAAEGLKWEDIERSLSRVVPEHVNEIGVFLRHSVFQALLHHLAATNQYWQYQELREYHVAESRSEAMRDPAVAKYLLVMKVNQVLDRSYSGNFEDLVANVSLEELQQPLVSPLGREAVSLPMKDVVTSFGDDLFSILKLYALLTNRDFPYGAHCFGVAAEQRVRFISGQLTEADLSGLSQSDSSYQWHKLGFKLCLGRGKELARNKTLSVAADFLRRSPIRYLGLEQPHLEFVRRLCGTVVFQSEPSVIAERDPRTFKVMQSLSCHGDAATKQLLSNFKLQLGSVEDLIPGMLGRFNFVFLDFFGFMTQSYEKAISGLFDSDRLQDRAVVFLTLLDIPMSRVRAAKRGYVGDPGTYVPEMFQRYAGDRFVVSQLLDMTYAGGMSHNVSTNMRVFGFGVVKN